jgi:hypothetical protein
MINRSVLLPHRVPTATATQAPSKLAPLFRDAARGSSAAGFRAGFSRTTARGTWREPDNDFSSLPMLPPVLPDCASASPDPDPTNSNSDARAVPTKRRIRLCISMAFKCLKEKMLSARTVGTDRTNNAARFASFAAVVKGSLFRSLDRFALN